MQGYITLAIGPPLYLELAINLALSLKLNDPTRPVCVVVEKGATLPSHYKPFVDHLAYLEPRSGFHGCLNKLRMHELSPFDETMFVDSDCILVKNDMDRHWEKHASDGFTIAGDKVSTGHWYGFSIAEALDALEIGYMVRMNSGVFYFRNGSRTRSFFDTALDLVANQSILLGKIHRTKRQLADEPFIGAAMGVQNLEPISYEPEEGSIMVTTINSSEAAFDPFSKTSHLVINSDFRFARRFLPGMSVAHSPSFAHFVRLKPRSQYRKITSQLRKHFHLPPGEF